MPRPTNSHAPDGALQLQAPEVCAGRCAAGCCATAMRLGGAQVANRVFGRLNNSLVVVGATRVLVGTVVLVSLSAHADSWMPPTARTISSPDGQYSIAVTPEHNTREGG